MTTALTVELANSSGTRVAALEHVDDLKVIAVRNKPIVVSGDVYVAKERHALEQWDEGLSRLLVYLGDTLIAHTLVGPCVDIVEGGVEKLRFTSADPSAMPLGRRRVQSDVTYTAQDQGAIIKARIDAQNTRATTFIGTSTYSFTTGTNRTVTFEKGKPEAEIIADLCNAYDGVDFAIIPTADGTTKMGEARVWAERGSVLTGIALEAGTSGKRNVESFTVTVDPSRITTHQRVTGRDAAESEDDNATTQTTYGTILDSLDTLSDISDTTILAAYRDQMLAWRSEPRRVVTIQPSSAMTYLPVVDFDLADYIPVHLDGGRWTGDRAITGAVRCYGWELTRGAGGAARVASVTVLPENQGGIA
jgi:hypothetical protein